MFDLMISRNTTNPDEAQMEHITEGRISIFSDGVRIATIWMDPDGAVSISREWNSIPDAEVGENQSLMVYNPNEYEVDRTAPVTVK